MSQEVSIHVDEESESADETWVGREAMVTRDEIISGQWVSVPWYDGIVLRVTKCGSFVEVRTRGFFYTRRWHDVDDVYLTLKGKCMDMKTLLDTAEDRLRERMEAGEASCREKLLAAAKQAFVLLTRDSIAASIIASGSGQRMIAITERLRLAIGAFDSRYL